MIIAVTGHQRIPEEALPFVCAGMRSYLVSRLETSQSDATLISCLATGADQLVASTALELGYRLRAMIPSRHYDSTFDVDGLSGYRSLLARADETVTLDFDRPCEEAYMAAGLRLVDDCDELLALWDGYPAAGLGGTGDVVAYARQSGRPVHVVWPTGVRH
ncbi:hypothetical protein [Bifidobacterium simiarum]|nr:hypothetical protein [Bifidobacterium simiarum]